MVYRIGERDSFESYFSYSASKTPDEGILTKISHKVGGVIRDAFFFPLNSDPKLRKDSDKKGDNFFNFRKACDPNFRLQSKIRRDFHMYDQRFNLNVGGKKLKLTCRVVESKVDKGEKHYNFLYVPGNGYTRKTGIHGLYSYIAAYMKLKKEDKPPARFVIFTEYDLRDASGKRYAPTSLWEAGLILKETLVHLKEKFGTFHQSVGHSLGAIISASANKHFKKKGIIPLHMHYDRAPASIDKAAKKFWYGFLIAAVARLVGWSMSLEDAVVEFCNTWKGERDVSASGVDKDWIFGGDINLSSSPGIRKLKEKGKLKLYLFHPRDFHDHAHHNLRAEYLNRFNLMKSQSSRMKQRTLPLQIVASSIRDV